MGKLDYDKVVYVTVCDGDWMWINECTLRDFLYSIAEETNSPRGVMPKYFIDDMKNGTYRISHWMYGRDYIVIDEYSTFENAENDLLEIYYQYDYPNSDCCCDLHDTYDEAIKSIAEFYDVSVDVAKSITDKYEKIRRCRQL